MDIDGQNFVFNFIYLPFSKKLIILVKTCTKNENNGIWYSRKDKKCINQKIHIIISIKDVNKHK